MQAQFSPWGNSQGIRFPKSLLQDAGISVNDRVHTEVKNSKIIIEKAVRHRSLEERAAQVARKLGPYTEFDWGEPTGREVW